MFNKERKLCLSVMDRRTLLEALAEEASELSQAALKCIRSEGLNTSPTPVTANAAYAKLVEELGDLLMMVDALGIVPPYGPMIINTSDDPKWGRCANRLKEAGILEEIDG